MSRLHNQVLSDFRFQFRYGFFWAYLLISVIYLVVLVLLPQEWRRTLAPLFLLMDPSFLGFFFLGGLVLLEKSEGSLKALAATPLRAREYLDSKALSLVGLSGLAALAIVLAAFPGPGFWMVLPALVLCGALFTYLGFVAVAASETVNDYMVQGAGLVLVFALPVPGFLGWGYLPLWELLPTQAAWNLFKGAYVGLEAAIVIRSLVVLLVWLVLVRLWALWAFRRHVLGEGRSDKPVTSRPASRPRGSHGANKGLSKERRTLPWFLALVRTDFHQALRDPMLIMFLFIPVLLGLILRWGLPWLALLVLDNWAFDLSPWIPWIQGFLLMVAPSMAGMMEGFRILDERDQGMIQVLVLTPLGRFGYLAYRMVLSWVWGLLILGGVMLISVARLPGLVGLAGYLTQGGFVALAALLAPLGALLLGILASNKVEGLAIAKVLGFFYLVPLLDMVLSEPWILPFRLVAYYWTPVIWVRASAGDLPGVLSWLTALVAALVPLGLLARYFYRRRML